MLKKEMPRLEATTRTNRAIRNNTERNKSILETDFATYRGQVVRKPVNANPGLKVTRRIDFSCIKLNVFHFLSAS